MKEVGVAHAPLSFMVPSLRLYSIGGAAVVAGGALLWYFAARGRKTPEQRERERRELLNQTGRIIDGTVIDVVEIPSTSKEAAGPSQLLVYQYDVAGVQYEASQDITYLRHLVDVHSCKLGLPASVKYEPQNPGNSIVICEGWSGLHSGTPLVLGIQQMAKESEAKEAARKSAIPESSPVAKT